MNAGQVIEIGSHDELVEKNGAYKKLVARQLMKDEIKKIDENLK
jgi:ABC-type multidrug transport system fused ATPase/permease subunit